MVKRILVCAALLFLATGPLADAQQPGFRFPGVQYPKGQDVSPTFDGWERNPDGTFSMWFGYLNRNTEEEINVQLGAENTVDLGNGDQGQPTHFYPGRRWWVFKVVVPKDWPADKRLTWTLSNRGRTNQAKAWLLPEWEVDKLLIAANGASDRLLMILGRPIAEAIHEGDVAPVIAPVSSQTVTLPATAKLSVTITDDGIPHPREGDRTADGNVRGAVEGIRVRWVVYRGPGKVKFEPEVSPAAHGKPLVAQTTATFTLPGDYRIRVIASDAALFTTRDFDVTVKAR